MQKFNKKEKQVVIYGASGHGRVVLDILRSSDIRVYGFLDSDVEKHGKIIDGVKVLGGLSDVPRLIKNRKLSFVIGIGDNRARKYFYLKIKKLGGKITNAIHSSVIIAKSVKLGEGVVIASGAIICANSCIGNNTTINTGVIVEHNNIIGNHVHIAPGVTTGGAVVVKDKAFLGLGTTIIQCRIIGENTIVGAGSVVIEDIPANVTVVGVPTKIVKRGSF